MVQPALLAFLGLLLGGDLLPGGEIRLREVSAEVGLDFVHQRAAVKRFWLPEIMSGGGCWLDYDGDGDLDLYLVQGGTLGEEGTESRGNRLFRNEGVTGFVDVTESAGVGDSSYGMGCAVGDVDGDGFVDLYVTNVGENVLYRNLRSGRFERRQGSGLEDEGWGASAVFFDFDRDGDLDLFVANYVDWSPEVELECYSGAQRDYCHPDRYDAPAPDRLWRNRGDGLFDDVTGSSGIGSAFGNGLGVAVGDFDGDDWLDLLVANDGMANQLWLGREGGRFEESALLSGVAVNRAGRAEAGMGVQPFDVDGDLDLDLFLTHLRGETNTLYVNLGGAFFDDETARRGLGAPSLGFTGFGTGFADFDLDGHPDLFVANGRIGMGMAAITEDPFAEPDQIFRGQGGGRFGISDDVAIDDAAGPFTSRAALLADFDMDGDTDVAVVANGGPARLLRNQGANSDWITVRILDRQGAPATGATVEIEGHGSRAVQPGYGYCSSNSPYPSFGLGSEAGAARLSAVWPDGRRRVYVALPPRHIYQLPDL